MASKFTKHINLSSRIAALLFLCLPLIGSAQYPTFASLAEKKVDFTSEWDTVFIPLINAANTFNEIDVSTFEKRNPIYIHDIIVFFAEGGSMPFYDVDWNTARQPLTLKLFPFEYSRISKIAFRYSKMYKSQNKPALVVFNANRAQKDIQNTLTEFRRPEITISAPSPNPHLY
jgi:hypothetical protein